jgi:hypothetical protein
VTIRERKDVPIRLCKTARATAVLERDAGLPANETIRTAAGSPERGSAGITESSERGFAKLREMYTLACRKRKTIFDKSSNRISFTFQFYDFFDISSRAGR